jgi:hypothetical protein
VTARTAALGAVLAVAVAGGCAAATTARATSRPALPPTDDIPPRPADADADVAYYRERAATLATGVATEIARTNFVRVRRGRLYLGGERGAGKFDAALTSAFDGGNDQAIIDVTAKILAEDQADIRAHMLRAVALRHRGQTSEANFHREVAIGLIESIVRGGDGRGFDTAWTAFRIKEEYEVLKARGYVVESQSVMDHEGREFDVLRARSIEGGDNMTAYFDITELFAEEGRGFSR